MIIWIDGVAYLAREAAKQLGMEHRTLIKRVARGMDLDRPLQRHVRD